jgi:hypothetical protein
MPSLSPHVNIFSENEILEAGAHASTDARAERARRRERAHAQATTGARVERACKHQQARAAAAACMELARKHH